MKLFVSGFFLFIFSVNCHAQQVVEVRDESYHKPVFQNEYIRLLNVIIPPGDTSLYHRHYLPSIFVFLEETKIGMQDLGKSPGSMTTVLGQTWYNGYENGAQIHRAWTSDEKTNLHAIDIEILKYDLNDTDPVIKNPSLELLVDSPAARIYRVSIPDKKRLQLKWNNNPFVLVPYSGDIRINGKPQPRATYKFISNPSLILSTDPENSTAVFCYLYEIKV